MDTVMGELVNPSPPPRVLTLIAQELTPEAFLPYGQVVRPVADNANYGPDDAQLDLSRGVPRYFSGSPCFFSLFLSLFLSQLLGFASRFIYFKNNNNWVLLM
jgi:hypothetical protein